MSMRPPALDRLDSLSSLGDLDFEWRSPGHHRQPSDSGESTGLVQRCVVIQKDEQGFGFTVSGDRIVLVQSVQPEGAAMKAGVQEGDRIIKVNGTVVTNMSHLEVVRLIRSGAYVALTLLGSPPSSVGFPGSRHDEPQVAPPPIMLTCLLPPPQRVTGPKPSQDPEIQKHATQILRNMLQQEEAELLRCYEVYSRNPASLLEERIEGARRRVSQLQLKIQEEMAGLVDFARLPSNSGSSLEGCLSTMDPKHRDGILDAGLERCCSASEVSLGPADPGQDGLQASRLFQHHRHQGSDAPFSPPPEQISDQMPRPLSIIGPEEDYDPGYLNDENDSLFQDLGRLKTRLAHLGVFLRYIFSQADPSPLLLYLCADVYQQMSPKEARGLGREIWHIFLDKAAPLRVKVSDQLLAEIDSRLRNGEDARSAFLEVQQGVMPEIQEQIQDYRTKRTMGLGSLYGENDLLDLDGDFQKERQVAERQIAQLGDILSKYEDRSSPMNFALKTYMIHVGICPREARPASIVEKSQEKDKWLPFFPKTKKSCGAKKEKEKESAVEDKKRNPILKYIAKPRSTSQSTFHVPLSPAEVKPGNVRNIIQHFENSQNYEGQEAGLQRLSTGSFPEDLFDVDSSRAEIRLGRSESLKGREELKRLRKAENVPRSRSDVDMDAAAEAARLHQSASSSASSLSTRSLENPTPPYTPKMGRRSIESPSLGFGVEAFLPHLLEDELGQLSDLEVELDSQNWQHTIGRDVVAHLPQREIDRQEVIHELFVTEASHLRILRVMDVLFHQPLKKEALLSREELALLFPNLPELIEIHNSLSESMRKLREEGPVVKEIGDFMLSRFDGTAGEEIQRVAAEFCAFQSVALDLIKTKKRKEARFQLFMQEAESNPQCRRLQLKDLLISEMQRLTKYPLLLENILKHTSEMPERHKLCQARDRCRETLRCVNEAVRQAENQHRLEAYQKRLDASSLERTSNPLAAEFKSLDLRSRRMIHEGLLSWRISKDKTVDIHVLLLEGLLVLLQRQDEKLVLKCHSKMVLGSSDTKQTFSPVLKLNSVLVRSVATDKRALFIICTSELGPQIYELVASTSLEKNIWMDVLEEAVKSAMRNATLQHPCPPQEPHPSRPAVSRVTLQDAETSARLNQDAEEEEGASDDTPTETFVAERLEIRGQVEEEEEEVPSAAGHPLAPLEQDPPGRPPVGPPGLGSLADSALADVESLRRLLLHSFLPSWDSEAEEDLTPTTLVVGSHQGWDLAPTGRLPEPPEGCDASALPGPLLPDLEGSRIKPRVPSPTGALGTGGCGGVEDTPEPQEAERPSGYTVVRKADVEAVKGTVPMLEAGSLARADAGGADNADGNCFYLSLPAGSQTSHRDAGEPADPLSPPASLPLARPLPLSGGQGQTWEDQAGWTSSLQRAATLPPSDQGIQDLGVIFRTIDQLALKLAKLKDVEGAHQQLQRLLSGETTTDAGPGREILPELSQTSPGHRPQASSPLATEPDVNGLPLALQEVTL